MVFEVIVMAICWLLIMLLLRNESKHRFGQRVEPSILECSICGLDVPIQVIGAS